MLILSRFKSVVAMGTHVSRTFARQIPTVFAQPTALYEKMLSDQILASGQSPVKLLGFYAAKKNLLGNTEKLSIFSQIANLLYAMKNSGVSQKEGFEYWIKQIKGDDRFQQILIDLEKDVSAFSEKDLSVLCMTFFSPLWEQKML